MVGSSVAGFVEVKSDTFDDTITPKGGGVMYFVGLTLCAPVLTVSKSGVSTPR